MNRRELQRYTVYHNKYCKPSQETKRPYLPTYVICTNHLRKDHKELKGFYKVALALSISEMGEKSSQIGTQTQLEIAALEVIQYWTNTMET